MKKFVLFVMFATVASLVFVGCGGNEPEVIIETVTETVVETVIETVTEYVVEAVDWVSPMISVEKDTRMLPLWHGEYNLHRNETMEYVFRDGDDFDDIAITSDALLAGGAVPATLRVAYGGDGQHLVRLVAFAYSFFDHGRPTRIPAHTADPNPQEIMILWQNPENGHWFSMIQNGVGREAITRGQHNDGLVSLRNGNDVYTFLLNSETVETLSEMTLYVVATAAPTREDDYDRSGYSILFTLELPDLDNHFHSWEILAACGTMFIVDGE